MNNTVTNDITKTAGEAEQKNLERILCRDGFQGLKAILEKVSPGQKTLFESVQGAKSYEDLLGRLGYKLNLTNQVHVQDCYSRLGPAGGIKAVLPYYDIPTHSSFPTLVNFDGTVTTTQKSAVFFNDLLGKIKRELVVQPPKAVTQQA